MRTVGLHLGDRGGRREETKARARGIKDSSVLLDSRADGSAGTTKRRTLLCFYAVPAPAATRATSPRQLPTDHDHAVPTREYQIDQSSRMLLGRHRPCCPKGPRGT